MNVLVSSFYVPSQIISDKEDGTALTLPSTVFRFWSLKSKVMALRQAPPSPLLVSKHSIWYYRSMYVDTWIRNQLLNKSLMLTFFFSFVSDYLLLNFCYRAQWFLEERLWLGKARVD